jgi:hypothetical protein
MRNHETEWMIVCDSWFQIGVEAGRAVWGHTAYRFSDRVGFVEGSFVSPLVPRGKENFIATPPHGRHAVTMTRPNLGLQGLNRLRGS